MKWSKYWRRWRIKVSLLAIGIAAGNGLSVAMLVDMLAN